MIGSRQYRKKNKHNSQDENIGCLSVIGAVIFLLFWREILSFLIPIAIVGGGIWLLVKYGRAIWEFLVNCFSRLKYCWGAHNSQPTQLPSPCRNYTQRPSDYGKIIQHRGNFKTSAKWTTHDAQMRWKRIEP